MLIRTPYEIATVDWGNGVSRRFLIRADGVGYTLTDTLVRAGTRSLLHYPNHVEACYCISGTGWVTSSDGRSYKIEPGTLYALDEHDPHTLIADDGADLRLVCVFAPALEGDERHSLHPDGYSTYGAAKGDRNFANGDQLPSGDRGVPTGTS
jgi:L-ectoine synthase